MKKLQKNPPPEYSNGSAPLQTAVPYENLPQSVQQPVPVATAVVPSSHNDLPSTNPFSPNFVPQPPPSGAAQPSPAAQLFSPVSPSNDAQLTQSRIPAPESQRSHGNKKAVNLQRLDGKPYPATNSADKGPKQVKVAKDMFDGALPPMYRRQASDPIKPGDVTQALSNTHECETCGKKRPEGGSCTHCAKRRSSGARAGPTVSAQHSRTVSTGVASERSIGSSSTVAPSSTAASTTDQSSCNKCGRHRRPGSIDLHDHPSSPVQPNLRLQQAGLSIQPGSAGFHNPVYPQIDIIPPSATTYRRTNTFMSPATPYGEESPLVTAGQPAQPAQPAKKPESRGFRNNSIVRSLSRRLSRREKEKEKEKPAPASAPLPSQQLAASENQSGEQSAGRLINMISTAMQEPGKPNHQHQEKLTTEEPDRPGTPFSFVGERDETDAFGSSGNGEYFPNQQDKLDVIPRRKSADAQHSRFLSVDDAERPQITRFKSLRVGVNRVNQSISRSQSLKRLGSVKSAHHAWYVDGSDENAVPVF